ncbi:MAG: CNNM domain-containing protein [Elusimicrobiota bacterium]|nr:CNNM domain-containing protein [Endomicrobiia bacterium]MDW8165020.1 CNNM domain-containing protein [Elusimicrobiota bacterium]
MIYIYIIILMLLSAFFSGSEAALTSLSDYNLRKIFFQHKILKSAVKLWVLKPYRFIITILIGNTIVNLLLSEKFTVFFMEQLFFINNREIKEATIWIIASFIVIIFCELLPKIVSKNFPVRIASIAILPLYILQYFSFFLFSPILFFVEKYLSKEKVFYFTKIDEFKKILSDTTRNIFTKSINEIFERVTKFNDIKIREIYTPKEKVIAVDISNKTFQEVMDEILESGKTRVPVYYGSLDKIVGYILVKDLFYLCYGSECSISDVIHPILKVNLNDKAKDVLKKFKETQIHIAIVVDNNDKFFGIVTLEDVIEEIVGDILDEYDIKSTYSRG